ncbi:MAG TPA: hypothetical protein ENH75_07630, partial [archaeon]|nr:hypothetical protein [archaeon]
MAKNGDIIGDLKAISIYNEWETQTIRVIPIEIKITFQTIFMFFCFLMIRIDPCKSKTIPDIKKVARIGIPSQNKKKYEAPHIFSTIPIIISEVERRSIPPIM